MSPRDTLSYRYHGGEPALSALLCSHLQELHLKAESLVVSLPPPPSPPFPLPPLLATPGIKAYVFWGTLFIVCAALPLIRTFDLAQRKPFGKVSFPCPCWPGPGSSQTWLGVEAGEWNIAPFFSAVFVFLLRSSMLPAALEVFSWLGFAAQIRLQREREQCSKEAEHKCLFPLQAGHLRSWLHTPLEGFPALLRKHFNWVSLAILSQGKKPSLVRNQIKKALGNNEKWSLSSVM